MQKNVGTWDALMRITLGFTGLAWGISRMIQKPHNMTPLLVALLSGMKVAEGITRFCPMLTVMGATTQDSKTADNREVTS
ncbi:MAG: DUF2892 domain-containing protein [Firmicutes bacterium]|uniref:Inner membrane protein YgaP-like transmembrane domain-containing protein n=1 Tax=Melghirimyces thermohalophilus TaxID=1236220 RepID=A0A1G6PSR0_9BACL|nr:DUF2892 domain-containing protein [Melghirimyces thermohalophilus]MDA8351640.1 DUF2892 domain-containing protein [Bacillota bacterium]SDC83270.1 Protein of unknown function [Melghirimyces thermohalophilus]